MDVTVAKHVAASLVERLVSCIKTVRFEGPFWDVEH